MLQYLGCGVIIIPREAMMKEESNQCRTQFKIEGDGSWMEGMM